jgi:hypothetical protein
MVVGSAPQNRLGACIHGCFHRRIPLSKFAIFAIPTTRHGACFAVLERYLLCFAQRIFALLRKRYGLKRPQYTFSK